MKKSTLTCIFTALVLAGNVALAPGGANAFSLGSQNGGGGDDFSYLRLEDNTGQEFDVAIPYEGTPGYLPAAERALRDYVQWKDLVNITDDGARGFLFVLRIVADTGQISADELMARIGLDDGLKDDLKYKAKRAELLSRYQSIRAAAHIKDPVIANQRLSSNDQTLFEANAAVKYGRDNFPDDPAFDQPPLTEDDLRAIRRNVAEVNVDYFLGLFEAIDSGKVDAYRLDSHQNFTMGLIGELLYTEIQKDPQTASYGGDLVSGNKYNREIPAMIEDVLAARGIDSAVFYDRVAELHNIYIRNAPIPAHAPEIPGYSPAPKASTPQP